MSEAATTQGVWDFSVHLTCGCDVEFGARTTDEIKALTPYRKDGKFGSMRCPNGHCRRRVEFTKSTTDHVPSVKAAIRGEF